MLVNVGKLMSHTSTKGGGGVKHPFNPSLVDAWFMSGLSNNDKPSSIRGVKGNDLALKNFAYSFSSGFEKYTVDFTKYTGRNTTSNSISIYKEAGIDKGFATIAYSQLESDIPSYSIEIKGLDSGQILYYYRNNEGLEKNVTYNKDGIYELPICYKEGEKGISAGFTINSVNNITITQLPSAYEGALVFDGVDDVAYIENFDTLIGEEQTFTVIANYTVLPSTKYSYNLYFRNNNSNIVRVNTPPSNDAMSGIRIYTLDFKNNRILYKNVLDNEVVFTSFTASITPNIFSLNGYLSDGKPTETSTVAYDWIAIYRGSLTPEEIEEEKVKLESEWEGGKNELA